MAKSIEGILRTVSDVIKERGNTYYNGGYIESVVLLPDGIFTAEVSGSNDEVYNIKI